MTGLDTNVLVRYLTHDDLDQSKKASTIVEGAATKGEKLLIHPVVLCELVWVLETADDYGRSDVATTLTESCARLSSRFRTRIPLERLGRLSSGKGDFADYLIGRANGRLGATHTVTFDKELKGHRQFHVL